MGDVLNEAYAIAQCKECPWYKSCATPMRLTAEDIRRQIDSAPHMGGASGQPDVGWQNFLSSMASAAQNTLLEGCPVFVERMRRSPELARKLKEIMQNWQEEQK